MSDHEPKFVVCHGKNMAAIVVVLQKQYIEVITQNQLEKLKTIMQPTWTDPVMTDLSIRLIVIRILDHSTPELWFNCLVEAYLLKLIVMYRCENADLCQVVCSIQLTNDVNL